MRFSIIATVFACLICGQLGKPESSEAQGLGQAIHDYWLDKPFQYQPSDPWVRSKIFQIQTGHYGRFYNCDQEECKRYSPYICWKTHYEKDIPPRRGLWGGIKQDIAGVKQRIRDGAGDCWPNNRDGADCQQTQSGSAPNCSCAECSRTATAKAAMIAKAPSKPISPLPTAVESIATTSQTTKATGQSRPATEKVAAEKTPAPKFGLVQGRTFGTSSRHPEAASAVATTAANQPSPKEPSSRVAQRQSFKNYVRGVFHK